jgi:hypothetical protein
MKTSSNSNSLNYADSDMSARHVKVLASCYSVDAAGTLKGLHYSTTGATGAEWYS